MTCCKVGCEQAARFVLEGGGHAWPMCTPHLPEAIGVVRDGIAVATQLRIRVLVNS